MNKIKTKRWASPCGELVIGCYEGRLCMCDWGRESVMRRLLRCLDATIVESATALADETIGQLEEYFTGRRHHFDLPLLMAGTDLQKIVWESLMDIPYGETVSYRVLAEAIGRPTAVRAVANAVGANALSIIVPCHRVTGADGSLTGYAGGLDAKRLLLDLERV